MLQDKQAMDMVDNVRFRNVAPLYNFDSDLDGPIELDAKTIIRRILPEERARMLDRSGLGPQVPIIKVYQLKHVAEITSESRNENPFDDMDNLISALRLFKPGNVSFDQVRISPIIRKPGLTSGTLTRFTEPGIIPGAVAYRLDISDVGPWKRFWTEFSSSDSKSLPTLGVALRRFNFGYSRVHIEDRLLDFVIAFEALLLKENERSKAHRLAHRVASLVGKDTEDMRRVYQEMKRFYCERSSLVHGRVPSLLAAETLARVEENLRRCIREMLVELNLRGYSETLHELDEKWDSHRSHQ